MEEYRTFHNWLHSESLILVRDSLEPQELFDSPVAVEPSKATGLRATMG
jgi:hypothetical protein